MKISSASKKVLASALSAAMVVAFAPTVAFGATAGQKIAVQYDVNGGAAPAGSEAFSTSEVLTAATSSSDVVITPTVDASGYKNAEGYAFAGWWYDADADGVVDDGEVTANQTAIKVNNVAGASTIKLVAQYAIPSAKIFASGTAVRKAAASSGFAVEIDASGAISESTYTLTFAGPDGVIYTKTFDGADFAAVQYAKIAFNADASVTKAAYQLVTSNTAKVTAPASAYKTGKYSITVSEGAKQLSTVEFEVVEISFSSEGNSKTPGTFQNGAGSSADPYTYTTTQTVKALAGAKYADVLAGIASDYDIVPGTTNDATTAQSGATDNAATPVAFKGYNKSGKALASYSSSFSVSDTAAKVAANDVLVAVYDYARTAGLSYSAGTLTLGVAGISGTGYDVEFSGPAGTKTVALANGATSATFAIGEGDSSLGAYTATLVKVENRGTATEKRTAVNSESTSVVKVTFDKGEGASISGTTTFTQLSGTKITTLPTVTAKTGKVNNGWTVDGQAVKLDESGYYTVPAGTKVTVVAAYVDAATVQAKVPTYTYADGKVTFAQDNGADYELTYGTNGTTFAAYKGGAIAVATTGANAYTTTLFAKAEGKATATLIDSEALAVFGYATVDGTAFTGTATPLKTVQDFADAELAKKTSKFKSTSPEYYKGVLTTTKKAAEDAIKAVGYASAKDWKTAVAAQEKAVVTAIADVEKANLKAAKTPVKSADGKTYSYLSENGYAAAVKAIDQILADFDILNDDDATNDSTAKTVTAHAAGAYAAAISAAASVTLSTADATIVEAGTAVSAELKAAATAEAAKAALAKYAALTAAQKEFVSAADVAAAEAVVAKAAQDEAAAKLVKAQDKAAAADGKAQVKGATYKIKAKGSKTIKIAKSASGAKVTLKQVSGTKYAKVSGTKVTLKKAAKKGKKYTIKVKAVCGATTTSTVSFKVLVK